MGLGELVPVDQGPKFVCRVAEQFGDGSKVYVIENRRPTFWVEGELPGISNAKLWEVLETGFGTWGKDIDIRGSRARSAESANLYVLCTRLDGRGGVLGDCELPRPGLRQQRMRLDTSEQVSIAVNASLDLQAIVNHELGHFIGYVHWPVGKPAELMEPSIQRGLRDPQPTEVAWGIKVLGPAVKEDEPAPTPPIGPLAPVRCTLLVQPDENGVYCKIGIEAGDRQTELHGTKKWDD